MSPASERRALKASREAFTRLVCRWTIVGLIGCVVLFVAALLTHAGWALGGTL